MEQHKTAYVTSIGLFFIGGVIYYLIRMKIFDAGKYYIDMPLLELFVLAFFIIVGQVTMWVSRYSMPHVTTNNFTGSVLNEPITIKDVNDVSWLVFNTGGYLHPFPSRGKLATLVVPKGQTNKTGMNYVGLTFVKKVPVRSLPYLVYSYLMHNKEMYNLTNVYFGKYSAEFYHENPKVAEYEAEITGLHNQVNTRDDVLEGRNDMFIEQKKFADEMAGTQAWYKKILKPKPTPIEEEQ